MQVNAVPCQVLVRNAFLSMLNASKVNFEDVR